MRQKCKVTKVYEAMPEGDREVFRLLIIDPGYSGGRIAELLTHEYQTPIDRMAVDHFRRKLRIGKAEL